MLPAGDRTIMADSRSRACRPNTAAEARAAQRSSLFRKLCPSRPTRRQDDFVQGALRFSTNVLPVEIGGLLRGPASAGSVATYGDGFGLVAVLALPAGLLERTNPSTIAASKRPSGGVGRVVWTPLVNVMGITAGPTSYVIAGPATVAELAGLAAVLAGVSG